MSVSADQEILQYLESPDKEVVKHFVNTCQEKLYSTKDSSLLFALIDRYIQTKSTQLIDLLVGVNDTHVIHLFERLNEHLKHGSHLEVATLLFSIVTKQPSWLHRLVGTSLFVTFLKLLKQDNNDIIFVMLGIIILCSLLPSVPAMISQNLGDVMEIFIRTAGLLASKGGNIPEICALHLRIGLYIFFHRLYTMYPNNFMSYMKSCFGERKNDPVYQCIVRPMFEFVKFHPDLITETRKSETHLDKWKVYQPHDILADCAKLSLDPVDAVKEATFAVDDKPSTHCSLQQKLHKYSRDIVPYLSHSDNNISVTPPTTTPTKNAEANTPPTKNVETTTLPAKNVETVAISTTNNDSLPTENVDTPTKNKEYKSEDKQITPPPLQQQPFSNFSLCNPSEVCGMATPPSSRPLTPSNSSHDVPSLVAGYKVSQSETDSNASNQNIDQQQQLQQQQQKLLERKSSGETGSCTSRDSLLRHSLKKTKSVDNIQKAKLKMWISSTTSHSTPNDNVKNISPQRSNSVQSNRQRPHSTELFKIKKDLSKTLSLGLQDEPSAVSSAAFHSAPVSPIVHINPNFTFNVAAPHVVSRLVVDAKVKEEANNSKERKSYTIIDNDHTHHVTTSSLPPSVPLLNTIQEMFAKLVEHLPAYHGDQQHMDGNCKTQCSKRSPLSLLDEFILNGANLHSYELSRIPLTSQLEVDWTYYGGQTPVDELRILQTQVKLMHIQLLYERHKCNMHCLRNRRLFGHVLKSESLQRELEIVKEHIDMTDNSIKEIKHAVYVISEENRIIKAQSSTRGTEYSTKIYELEEKVKEFEYKTERAKLEKAEFIEIITNQKKELNNLRHQLFEKDQELVLIQPNVIELEDYKEKVNRLTKELLKQGEKQELVKTEVENFKLNNNKNIALERKLDVYKREFRELEIEKEMLLIELNSFKTKSTEYEVLNVKKEKLLRDHKEEMNNLKLKHKNEISLLESRFEGMQKTCQSLQSYISSLYSKLETHGNTPHKTNTRKATSYAGIDTRGTFHDNSHRHSLLHSASTENPFTRHRASSYASSTNSLSAGTTSALKRDKNTLAKTNTESSSVPNGAT